MSIPDRLPRKPEMKKQPRITPETERIDRANKMVAEVEARYQEQYRGESELFGHALSAYRTLLIDFVPTPRASHTEALMADNIQAWAKKMNMIFDKDERGNVAAILPGDPEKIIVLQHHLDIVADRVVNSPVDPREDSIIPQHIEGQERDIADREVADDKLWLQAENAQTTLGADNGAGGAIIRATVERIKQQKEASDNPEIFPTIIVLGTVEEEAHFGGVKNLHLSPETTNLLAKADYIINDDMEIDNPRPLAIEGAFGLEAIKIEAELEHEPLDPTMQLMQIDLTDFTGGHSGLHAGLPHAGAVLISQLTESLGKPGDTMDWRLSTFQSGNADNQIAETALAVIAVPRSHIDEVHTAVQKLSKKLPRELEEKKAKLTFENLQSGGQQVLTNESTQRVFSLLSELSALQGINGTFMLRDQILYHKAYNLGIVRLQPESLQIEMSTRIGQADAFGYYPQLVRDAAEKARATFSMNEPVEIWPPDESSHLPALLQQTYQELVFDKGDYPYLAVEVVTAGLELGELHKRFPKSRNITLGIWMDRIHKPGERMQIPSFIENAMLTMKFTDKLVAELATEKSNGRRPITTNN